MVLALACAGQFMVILDASIVNVALPSVQRDLGFTTTGLAWVVNGYLLTFAGFMLLGGRAGDAGGGPRRAGRGSRDAGPGDAGRDQRRLHRGAGAGPGVRRVVRLG